jgi:hypothetical protein
MLMNQYTIDYKMCLKKQSYSKVSDVKQAVISICERNPYEYNLPKSIYRCPVCHKLHWGHVRSNDMSRNNRDGCLFIYYKGEFLV